MTLNELNPAGEPWLAPGAGLEPVFARAVALRCWRELLLAASSETRPRLGAVEPLQALWPALLKPEDWAFLGPDDALVPALFGAPLATLLAREHGMEAALRARAPRLVAHPGTPAAGLIHGAGVGWALQLERAPGVVLAVESLRAWPAPGAHQALNFAGLRRLPLVLLVLGAGRALDAFVASDVGAAYGVRGVDVSGADVLATQATLTVAFERARSGAGPTLVAVRVPADGTPLTRDDPSVARTLDELDGEPLSRLVAPLGTTRAAELREQVSAAAQRAFELAWSELSKRPAPSAASLVEHVYASPPWHLVEQATR